MSVGLAATSGLAGLVQHCCMLYVCAWQQSCKNPGCFPKGCFSGCLRFGSMNYEVTQDAIQQRQQPENGVSVSQLSCCFALVHIWCMCCATAVQTDFPDVCNAALPVLSSVHVSLSLSHSKFKNVCKHTSAHRETGTSGP